MEAVRIQHFSKLDAIRFGWETFKKNLGFLIVTVLLVLCIYLALGFIQGLFEEGGIFVIILFTLASLAAETVVNMGFITILLKLTDGKKAQISDLFTNYKYLINYFFASLLYGLIIFAGFILLIIPGIIWAIKFQFNNYLVLDKGLSPIDALKESARITKGEKWNLLLFGILLGCIQILGFLALGVGLLVTYPLSMLAVTYVYRKLSSRQ